MRSPAAAFRWEFGARHQWVLIALAIYLVTLGGIIKPLVLGPGAKVRFGDGFIGFGLVPFSFAFMYFIAVFSFGLNGDLAGRASIFPSRLFTLPVPTAALARWPMVYGGAAMMLLWFGTAIVARWPLGLELPLVWPALLGAVVMAWTQALTWMPYGLRGIRVIAATAVLISIDATVITAIELELPERTLIAFLAPQLLLAYAIACYAVGRARRGVVPDWWVFNRARPASDRSIGSAFSSPARAQLWFEWRRHGRSLPALVALVLPFELLLFFVGGYGSKSFVYWVTIMILATPMVLAAFAATTISKANPFAREAYGVSPFLATRPMTSAGLIAAKLKMAWWSTALTWALMVIVAPIGIAWSRADTVLIDLVQRMTQTVGVPRSMVLIALIFAIFVMLTWVMLVQSLYLGLTGRVWIIKTSGFVVLVLFSLMGPAFQWFINSTPAERWLWNNWPILVGALVAMKTAASLWVTKSLHRRRLLTDQRLLLLAAGWLGVVAVLYGTFVWWIDTSLVPRYVLAMIATLLVPFARLAAAPLALAVNRHQ
jgi:hypothetical protein